jgi:hypothetical protein
LTKLDPAGNFQAHDRSLQVIPITDIPCPALDLDRIVNPLPAIMRSAEFVQTKRFFAESPSAIRSLLTDAAQALLYSVIRSLRPEHVVEIGTYKAGTAEGLARAVLANGFGTVHTISPFDAERVAAISVKWPPELQAVVRYQCVDSMTFFMHADQKRIRPAVVLVDGNHDYEFASFDIQATARRLEPGGFIFIDNVSQAGPYYAAMDFLARHSDWIDCGEVPATPGDTKAFNYTRSNIPLTDFFVLRAPSYYVVGNRPQTFGEVPWANANVHGLRLSLARSSEAGTLRVQCVLRAFSEMRIAEVVGEGSKVIDRGEKDIDIVLSKPIGTDGVFDTYVVESWLVWIATDRCRSAPYRLPTEEGRPIQRSMWKRVRARAACPGRRTL